MTTVKEYRKQWWSSLSHEAKSAYIAKQEHKRQAEPYIFPKGTVLKLTSELKQEIGETMHTLGMGDYIPWG